jgi:hypothetical protein
MLWIGGSTVTDRALWAVSTIMGISPLKSSRTLQ